MSLLPDPNYYTTDRIKRKTLRQETAIHLINGEIILGKIFVSHNERILDIMNDERKFVPVEETSGEVRIISKSSILTVESYEGILDKCADNNKENVSLCPYDILELSKQSSLDEVKQRYLQIKDSVDIDIIRNSNLDKDIVTFIMSYLEQVQKAYKILSP